MLSCTARAEQRSHSRQATAHQAAQAQKSRTVHSRPARMAALSSSTAARSVSGPCRKRLRGSGQGVKEEVEVLHAHVSLPT